MPDSFHCPESGPKFRGSHSGNNPTPHLKSAKKTKNYRRQFLWLLLC